MDTKWIQSNPSIMMGKPVIAGTRIPVELILEKFAAGETIEQLLEAYPRLTKVKCFVFQGHSIVCPFFDRIFTPGPVGSVS